eukprot:scaffold125414_cov60-Phaeocystis_antarctica.AAC.2
MRTLTVESSCVSHSCRSHRRTLRSAEPLPKSTCRVRSGAWTEASQRAKPARQALAQVALCEAPAWLERRKPFAGAQVVARARGVEPLCDLDQLVVSQQQDEGACTCGGAGLRRFPGRGCERRAALPPRYALALCDYIDPAAAPGAGHERGAHPVEPGSLAGAAAQEHRVGR